MGGRGKYTQSGCRRNLSGPAGAFQLDHTPAMTVPNRKFTLMGTDRSSFFKGGEKKPKARPSPYPQYKTGNHSPRVLDVRPAQKKKGGWWWWWGVTRNKRAKSPASILPAPKPKVLN